MDIRSAVMPGHDAEGACIHWEDDGVAIARFFLLHLGFVFVFSGKKKVLAKELNVADEGGHG